jgi:hypothetical protein
MQNENDIIEINITFPPLGLLVFMFHVIMVNIIVSKVVFERDKFWFGVMTLTVVWESLKRSMWLIFLFCPQYGISRKEPISLKMR